MFTKLKAICTALTICCVFTPAVFGDYLTATIDGDFSEWAGVSTFATDAADNAGSIDFTSMQIANDENFLYVRYTVNESISSANFFQVSKAADEDNDTSTGFDIFGLGVVGSEAGWQGDFPFEQATGVFNTGNGLTSGVIFLAACKQAAEHWTSNSRSIAQRFTPLAEQVFFLLMARTSALLYGQTKVQATLLVAANTQ